MKTAKAAAHARSQKGKVGTGAPPPSPTEGWEIIKRVEYQTGTYFFLNISVGAQRGRITVKARNDGTYLCLTSACLDEVKGRLLHYSDGPYSGCVHARFVRDHDRGAPAPHDAEPPPPTDSEHADTEATHAGDDDTDAPIIDENGEHIPPF